MIGFQPEPPTRPPEAPRIDAKPVELTINGAKVTVPEGSTILQACRARGVDVPTLCWAENLTPVNVCRICVVELKGARVLVPACSRKVEPGMEIQTESERVKFARRMVVEFLASTTDLSTAPESVRRPKPAGLENRPIIDNDLYVRDYAKCILCYKCVEACGTDAQFTFAIAVAGRGHEAHISTERGIPLPESACVYCGNCIGVCPTGALMFKSEFDLRQAGTWDESRQKRTDTICSYCGVGCTLTLHTQDNTIVKVTSPADASVTHGHLCIKGRFGFQFVQNRGPHGRT